MGGNVLANLYFYDLLGDIDMSLLEADGERIDYSASSTNDEQVEGANLPPGSYYLRIYVFSSPSGPDIQPYTLIVSVSQTSDAGVEDGSIP